MNRDVEIEVGSVKLGGFFHIPENAHGIVIFVHGSGSSRHSPRNQFVASFLNNSQLATLLVDLFSSEEEALDDLDKELRFNIDFLAKRLLEITKWVKNNKESQHLNIGYFGASTGAAAALVASAEKSDVKAIVSRGGRPDLAGASLKRVLAPTLLIVGGNDYGVIELNEAAFEVLQGKKKMEIVPGATHLFEEPGALEKVAHLARDWFLKWIG